MNSIANGTNSIKKATNSIAKTCNLLVISRTFWVDIIESLLLVMHIMLLIVIVVIYICAYEASKDKMAVTEYMYK